MVPLLSLWMPILVAAVLVFVASSLIHMMLPYHRNDYSAVPNEDAVMDALRPFAIAPGDYALPKPATIADMKSPAFVEKVNRGPVIIMTVLPDGVRGMGAQLLQWFLYAVLIGVFAAYVAGRALPPGAEYMEAFRFAGTTAFAGYGLALIQGSIWYRRRWSTTLKSVFDALVYGMLTGGAFGWLWP